MNTWQKVLSYLKSRVNPQGYETWLRPTRLRHANGDTLYVRVPSKEFDEWIRENFGGLIREALEASVDTYTLIKLAPWPARRWKCRYRLLMGEKMHDAQSAAEAYAMALLAALENAHEKS